MYFTLRKFVDDIELAGVVDTAENKNSKKKSLCYTEG